VHVLDCKQFFDAMVGEGLGFYAGVPDSLLKDFCAYVTDHTAPSSHVITANEGSAMGLAAGHHLATGDVPVVYMQNSGFGNTVNPLTSLADAEVYAIPMILVVGWRGEPGKKDEPQHVKIGRVQEPLLAALEIEHAVLPDDFEAARATLQRAVARAKEKSAPFALLVRAGTFDKYKLKSARTTDYAMTREEAIGACAEAIGASATIVCTTGMPSRELFEHRTRQAQDRASDFLTVGSMGHASQIALGVALKKPGSPIYCFDGDGAALMHLGGLSTIGALAPKNFRHIVFNNGAHDSVGGQPTVGFDVDLCAIAEACGYRAALRATNREELAAQLAELAALDGPVLLEVRVKTGARADVGRPTATPRASKEAFMARLRTMR
jgi:phosphonopyruvate decarboxylase